MTCLKPSMKKPQIAISLPATSGLSTVVTALSNKLHEKTRRYLKDTSEAHCKTYFKCILSIVMLLGLTSNHLFSATVDECVGQTDDSKAIEVCSQVLKKPLSKNDKVRVLYLRIRANYSKGRLDDIIRDAEAIIQLDPKFWKAYHNMAVAHLNFVGGQKDKVRPLFEKALSIYDNYKTNWVLGGFLMQEEKFSEAKRYLDRALDLNPDSKWAMYYRGMTNFELKNYRQSISDLKGAEERKIDMLTSHLHIGASYAELGEVELAKQHFAEFRKTWNWPHPLYEHYKKILSQED